MIEHVMDTGATGQLRIQDSTDDDDLMTVSMWIKSSETVPPPQRNNIPWAYSIETDRVDWMSFKYQNSLDWELLGSVYVGESETFTLHLGETGTTQLLGPTDLAIDLFGSPLRAPTVHINVNGTYKRAAPFVRTGGVWKPARPFVRTPGGWKELQ